MKNGVGMHTTAPCAESLDCPHSITPFSAFRSSKTKVASIMRKTAHNTDCLNYHLLR